MFCLKAIVLVLSFIIFPISADFSWVNRCPHGNSFRLPWCHCNIGLHGFFYKKQLIRNGRLSFSMQLVLILNILHTQEVSIKNFVLASTWHWGSYELNELLIDLNRVRHFVLKPSLLTGNVHLWSWSSPFHRDSIPFCHDNAHFYRALNVSELFASPWKHV